MVFIHVKVSSTASVGGYCFWESMEVFLHSFGSSHCRFIRLDDAILFMFITFLLVWTFHIKSKPNVARIGKGIDGLSELHALSLGPTFRDCPLHVIRAWNSYKLNLRSCLWNDMERSAREAIARVCSSFSGGWYTAIAIWNFTGVVCIPYVHKFSSHGIRQVDWPLACQVR